MNDKSSSSLEEEKSEKNKSGTDSSNKKSENDNSLDLNQEEEEHLINYFSYINDCSTKIEEDRQNYFNKLSELKLEIEKIKTKSIPSSDYILLLFSEFVKLCDTYYSSFAEQKKILKNFSELNDSAQNINFCYEKANYSNTFFKESNKKLTKQNKKIIKENQILQQALKEMRVNINNKNKNQIEDDIKEMKKQKEIQNKMDKLNEENVELKKRYTQILRESKIYKEYANEKNTAEEENKRRMSSLLNKLDNYEDKIGKMQKQIKQYETERLNTENQEKESRTLNINNRYENENTINLETNKSELSDNISQKQGMNLEELLMNQNDFEEEEDQENNINNEQNSVNIKQIKNEKNSDESSKSIKRYNEYDIDQEVETSPNFLMLCPVKSHDKKLYSHQRSKNLKTYKNPFALFSPTKSQASLRKNRKKKNAQSVINGGKNSTKSYYKIFFFLLLKAIIINKNIKEFFKKYDFDSFYEECEKGRIPFNQYEEWIINKFKLNEDKNDKSLYDEIINDSFISTSMI